MSNFLINETNNLNNIKNISLTIADTSTQVPILETGVITTGSGTSIDYFTIVNGILNCIWEEN